MQRKINGPEGNDALQEYLAPSIFSDDDDDWVDVGYEISKWGQKTHVWIKKEDVPEYVNNLRNELSNIIDRLEHPYVPES